MLKVRVRYTILVIVSLALTRSGTVYMTCDSLNTFSPTNAKCTCSNSARSGVQWFKNRIYIAECYIVIGTCSSMPGYTFTVDTSTSIYTMTREAYSYSECDEYTCADLVDTSIHKTDTFSFNDLTYTPIINEPPSDHMNGSINITTDCLYNINLNASAIKVQWFAVVGDVEKGFNPKNPVISKDNSACQSCTHRHHAKLFAGFDHEENGTTKAKIRIVINYGGFKLNTTSENMYLIEVGNDGNATANADLQKNKDWIKWMVIISMFVTTIIVLTCVFLIKRIWNERKLIRVPVKTVKNVREAETYDGFIQQKVCGGQVYRFGKELKI